MRVSYKLCLCVYFVLLNMKNSYSIKICTLHPIEMCDFSDWFFFYWLNVHTAMFNLHVKIKRTDTLGIMTIENKYLLQTTYGCWFHWAQHSSNATPFNHMRHSSINWRFSKGRFRFINSILHMDAFVSILKIDNFVNAMRSKTALYRSPKIAKEKYNISTISPPSYWLLDDHNFGNVHLNDCNYYTNRIHRNCVCVCVFISTGTLIGGDILTLMILTIFVRW